MTTIFISISNKPPLPSLSSKTKLPSNSKDRNPIVQRQGFHKVAGFSVHLYGGQSTEPNAEFQFQPAQPIPSLSEGCCLALLFVNLTSYQNKSSCNATSNCPHLCMLQGNLYQIKRSIILDSTRIIAKFSKSPSPFSCFLKDGPQLFYPIVSRKPPGSSKIANKEWYLPDPPYQLLRIKPSSNWI